MIFIFKANGDAIAGKGPELLFEAVVELFFPFAGEKIHYGLAAVEEFVAIPPFRIGGIGERDPYRVFCVPGVFGHLYFLDRGFVGEGREGRSLFHIMAFAGGLYAAAVFADELIAARLFAGVAKVPAGGAALWWISGLLWYF